MLIRYTDLPHKAFFSFILKLVNFVPLKGCKYEMADLPICLKLALERHLQVNNPVSRRFK